MRVPVLPFEVSDLESLSALAAVMFSEPVTGG